MATEYLDTLKTCMSSYGDGWQAYYATAEIAYFYQFGKLPDWGCFIEKIEIYEHGDLIIHRDPENAM